MVRLGSLVGGGRRSGNGRRPAEAKRPNGEWDLAALNLRRSPRHAFYNALVVVFALVVIGCCAAGFFMHEAPDLRAGEPAPGEVWFDWLGTGVVGLPGPERMVKFGEMLAGVIAAVGLGLGFLQWRDARHEASLEKYYERLDLANQRMEAIYELRTPAERVAGLPDRAPARGGVADVFARGVPPEAMWVFTELDNLEYVLVKYRLGYASPCMTRRALDNFEAKCRWVPSFARSAMDLADREAGSGFLDVTRDVVRAIAGGPPTAREACAPERPATGAAAPAGPWTGAPDDLAGRESMGASA